jgi:hypothetical protein
MNLLLTRFKQARDPRNRNRLIGNGLTYFLAHELALFYPDSAGVLGAVRPAGGNGRSALLLNPRSRWPVILAVMFATRFAAGLITGWRKQLSRINKCLSINCLATASSW